MQSMIALCNPTIGNSIVWSHSGFNVPHMVEVACLDPPRVRTRYWRRLGSTQVNWSRYYIYRIARPTAILRSQITALQKPNCQLRFRRRRMQIGWRTWMTRTLSRSCPFLTAWSAIAGEEVALLSSLGRIGRTLRDFGACSGVRFWLGAEEELLLLLEGRNCRSWSLSGGPRRSCCRIFMTHGMPSGSSNCFYFDAVNLPLATSSSSQKLRSKPLRENPQLCFCRLKCFQKATEPPPCTCAPMIYPHRTFPPAFKVWECRLESQAKWHDDDMLWHLLSAYISPLALSNVYCLPCAFGISAMSLNRPRMHANRLISWTIFYLHFNYICVVWSTMLGLELKSPDIYHTSMHQATGVCQGGPCWFGLHPISGLLFLWLITAQSRNGIRYHPRADSKGFSFSAV